MRARLLAPTVVALAVLVASVVPGAARAQPRIDIVVHVPPPLPSSPEPATVIVTPAQSPPAAQVVAAPVAHVHPASFGLELVAAAGRVFGEGAAIGEGASLVVHPLDRYPFEVAIDYERDAFVAGDRIDHRIGYSLYIGRQHRRLAPYVVIPMGVGVAVRDQMSTVVEGYVGIGAGARLRFARHWMITADASVATRSQAGDTTDATFPTRETSAAVRSGLGYYF